MMELHQFEYSPYCIKIRAVLNIKGLDYQTMEAVPFVARRARLRSGHTQVPVLCDGRRVLSDSTEIALYLDTAYPAPRLIPEAYDEYKTCMLWEDWADEALVPAVRAATFESIKAEPARGEAYIPRFSSRALNLSAPYVMRAALPLMQRLYLLNSSPQAERVRLERYLNLLVGSIASEDYLLGSALTLADIAVASSCWSLGVVPSIRTSPQYQRLFEWRDAILRECMVPLPE